MDRDQIDAGDKNSVCELLELIFNQFFAIFSQ